MQKSKMHRVWEIAIIIVAIIFFCLSILTFVSLGYTNDGAQIGIGVVSGIFFIVIGILMLVVLYKGRKLRVLVICVLIILIIIFFESMIQIILWSLARSNCADKNRFYHTFACGAQKDFFFALVCILLFVSIIGAACVFALCLLFRREDEEEHEQYVYLSGTDDTEF
eukprot:TRINITY_DN7774_c0_g1_i1.p1 TRINITY_DN7774_c0_g1~~TRINITY_DN7774_c0_g1_i1.p1  ORF type:complete len:167 (-),score=19.73 TRINITY_DN7774_c0_g1_i1:81-581(-)